MLILYTIKAESYFHPLVTISFPIYFISFSPMLLSIISSSICSKFNLEKNIMLIESHLPVYMHISLPTHTHTQHTHTFLPPPTREHGCVLGCNDFDNVKKILYYERISKRIRRFLQKRHFLCLGCFFLISALCQKIWKWPSKKWICFFLKYSGHLCERTFWHTRWQNQVTRLCDSVLSQVRWLHSTSWETEDQRSVSKKLNT